MLKDEGVGIHVVSTLEKEGYAEPISWMVHRRFHLLGFIQSYKAVILVDASLDAFPAGYIRELHPKYAKDFPSQLSAHEIGLKDLLDAAFLLGNMPEIRLIAISIKDFRNWVWN